MMPIKSSRLKGPWQYWMQRDYVCMFCSQFFENKELTNGTGNFREMRGNSGKTWIKLAGMKKAGKVNKVKRFATTLNERKWRKPYTPKSFEQNPSTEFSSEHTNKDGGYEYDSSSEQASDDSGSEKEEKLTLEEQLHDAEAEQSFLKNEIQKYRALKETLNLKKKKIEATRKRKEEEKFKHYLQRHSFENSSGLY